MTPLQRKMLTEASMHAIREPNTGAYRRPTGEVDNKSCFSSRSIKSAVARGWLQERPQGGFITTEDGMAVLTGKAHEH